MVIYEVNLTIAATVYQEFLAWMPGHIQQILNFPGFKAAKLLTEVTDTKAPANPGKLIVQYEIESLENLNQYLTEHSTKMRQEAIDKFADQFSASRRTLEFIGEFQTELLPYAIDQI